MKDNLLENKISRLQNAASITLFFVNHESLTGRNCPEAALQEESGYFIRSKRSEVGMQKGVRAACKKE